MVCSEGAGCGGACPNAAPHKKIPQRSNVEGFKGLYRNRFDSVILKPGFGLELGEAYALHEVSEEFAGGAFVFPDLEQGF